MTRTSTASAPPVGVPTPTGSRLTRYLATGAGIVYSLAWLVGLVSAPASPDAAATATAVRAYYAAHTGAAQVQSWLVHGVAGLALLAVVICVGAALRPRTPRVAGMALLAGAAAAAVSLTQVGLMEALTARLRAGGTAAQVRGLFDAINLADSVKLALLGALAAAVTTATARTGLSPAWLRWLGWILVPLLPMSGLAFPLRSAALYLALYVSLPLLLIWVTGVAVTVPRGRRVAGARR